MVKEAGTVFFDGKCNLCSNSVKFIASRDNGKFKFAPLSSEKAEKLETQTDSLVLLNENGEYQKSEAVAKILGELGFPWSIFGRIIALTPTVIADRFYDLIASIRYSLFGKKEKCMQPGPELQSRFSKQGS